MSPAPLVLAGLIAAAAYRVVLAVRQPAPWRTAMATALTLLAFASTMSLTAFHVDAATGVANGANLASRLALIAAVVAAQTYLGDTRAETRPARHRHQTVGVLAGVATIGAWVAAPIHEGTLEALANAPAHPASLIYTLVLYLHTGWFLSGLTKYAHHEYAALARLDPPAARAVLLIGAAGWTGIPVLALFALRATLVQTTDRPWPELDDLTTTVFPVPLALFAAGVGLLPLLPVLQHRKEARALARRVEALWRELIAQHPHLRLPRAHSRVLQTLAPRLVARRRLIEIADALEERRVPHATADLRELASYLTSTISAAPGRTMIAKDVLSTLDTAPWPAPLLHLADAMTAPKEGLT